MRKRPVARASRGVSPLAAMLLFFAFTAPLGIVAHLVSELAGLGWHDDADVVLSARHGYLALIALGALVALGLALRAVPRGDRRTRIAAIVDALPFKGQGARFVALSFAAQFGFFAITQIGEGCPLCGGDWWSCRCRAAVAPVRCAGRRDGPAGGHPGFRRAGGQNALACVVYPSARIFCSKTRKRPDRDRGLVGGAERETGRAGSRARA